MLCKLSMLSVTNKPILLSVVMLSVVMLNVIMLGVVAPQVVRISFRVTAAKNS
jgi:hypothetical protein